MGQSDDRTRKEQAVELLERALEIFDETGNHVAAAQLDHVIHLVQEGSDSDRGR